jgi:hypothetical protein
MTREQAEREAERLSREHPDRASYSWFAQQVGGVWSVVRVSGSLTRPRGVNPAVEAKPRPPQADDPRPASWRDLGGPYVGGT